MSLEPLISDPCRDCAWWTPGTVPGIRGCKKGASPAYASQLGKCAKRTPKTNDPAIVVEVKDNDEPCPCCGHVPDTHRKRQVRHLHCKSEGMVKFISELQKELGMEKGGFQKMLEAVRTLKQS